MASFLAGRRPMLASVRWDRISGFPSGDTQLAASLPSLVGCRNPRLYYFNVDDVDAAAKRVRVAGGQILDGPVEVPSGGWIAHCSDPQGAVFALLGKRSYKAKVTVKPYAKREISR